MKAGAIAAAAMAAAMLAGCSMSYYTSDLKSEYEEEAFASASDMFAAMGDVPATMELYAPDGLTRVVTGEFFEDGMPVQYVYDADTGSLWAAHAEGGYGYADACRQISDEIGAYLGSGTVEVSSLSWELPCKEYRYAVRSGGVAEEGSVRVVQGFLVRPFFRWGMSGTEAAAFIGELLHGAAGQVPDLSVRVTCRSFHDLEGEILGQGMFQAFLGLSEALVYEECDSGRYYRMLRQEDGSVAVTYHEKQAGENGEVRWRSTTSLPVAGGR